jgi:HEAT repeat protein
LLQALGDPSAHVRAAAAQALGLFTADISSIAALNLHASYDPSYAVIANSVLSLAALKAPGADAVLAKALGQASDRGVIASAALEGYAKLKGADAIALEEQYARYGAPLDTRDAAVSALGEIGKGHGQVIPFLCGLLGDPNPRVGRTTLRVISDLHDRAAVPCLQRYAQTLPFASQQRPVLEAVKAIQGSPASTSR